jgi:hypothetical protein
LSPIYRFHGDIVNSIYQYFIISYMKKINAISLHHFIRYFLSAKPGNLPGIRCRYRATSSQPLYFVTTRAFAVATAPPHRGLRPLDSDDLLPS